MPFWDYSWINGISSFERDPGTIPSLIGASSRRGRVKKKLEPTPVSLWFNINSASKLLDHHLWDSEAESHASSVNAPRVSGLPEELEELAQILRFDTQACITHIGTQDPCDRVELKVYSYLTCVCELYCVSDQVEEYLLISFQVTVYFFWQLWGDLNL